MDEARAYISKTLLEGITIEKWLRRQDSTWSNLPKDIRAALSDSAWEMVEVDAKYAGYIKRQEMMIDRSKRLEGKEIPDWMDYSEVRGLKKEAQQRLGEIKPTTLGQAGRVSGITPADIGLLAVWMEKRGRASADYNSGA